MGATNGAIPDALLVFADGSQRLRVGTASRWGWIAQQVQSRYGWTPHIISGGGYRSLQQQIAVFTARYVPATAGFGPYNDARVWNGVRYIRMSPAGAAAVPGTSNHGLGRAVDVDGLLSFTSTQRAQFAAVAAEVGFTDTEGRAVGEAWHWVDSNDPDVTTVSQTTTIGGSLPTAPGALTATAPQEDDDMAFMTYEEARALVALGQNGLDAIGQLRSLIDHMKGDTDRLPHIQEQVDISTAALGNVTNGVVALLGRSPAAVSALSDDDLARIAKAVNDEQSKRLAS